MKTSLLKCTFLGLMTILFASCGSDDTALSSQKVITDFTVAGVSATVNQSTRIITAIVPDETDLTSLTPTILFSSNATVTPASGVAQDFSAPVTYTVTAEDGTSVDYTANISTLTFEFTFEDKRYEIVKETMNWRDAAAFAVERGGYLAEINTGREQAAIFSALINDAGLELDNFARPSAWIGGNDFANDGVWIWDGDNDGNGDQFWMGGVDGMSVNDLYNNWGNEPDGQGAQDALVIVLTDTPINMAGQWNDLSSDGQSFFFVIEYD